MAALTGSEEAQPTRALHVERSPGDGPARETAARDTGPRDSAGGADVAADPVDALLASAPIGVAFFDADLRVSRVNQPFLDVLGCSRVDVVGRCVDDIDGLPLRLVRWLRRALDGGEPVDEREIAVPETGPPGTRRHYLVRCFPLLGTGSEIVGAGAVTVDITDRRHSEAAVGLVVAASDLFASSAGLDELLDRVVRLAVPLFADACALYLRDGAEGQRWLWAETDASGDVRVGRGEGPPPVLDVVEPVEQALRAGRTLLMGAAGVGAAGTAVAGTAGAPADAARSLIAAPLVTAGRVLGVLTFINRSPGRAYVRASQVLAEELARRCADAIQNARLTTAEAEARDRLELLARVGELMTVELDSSARLDGTTRLAIPHFADLCVVYLSQADGTAQLASFAHVDPTLEALFATLSDWPALGHDSPAPPSRAIRENQPVLVTDVNRHQLAPFLDDEQKREAAGAKNVRSMLAVPLPTSEGPLGAIAFAYTDRNYVPADVPLAVEIARRVAPAVENALRFEHEHATAETLQRSLLPQRLVEPETMDLVARYLPAAKGAKIGGDWYDVVTLGAERTMVVIGDVLGHGIRAAASMSKLRTAFQVYALEGMTGPEILDRLNTFVVASNRHAAEPTMASILVAEHDARTGALRLANAGHVPPFLRRVDGGVDLLKVTPCTPVGAVAGAAYQHTEMTIDPGAVLLMYTDGLVERRYEPLDESFARLGAEVARAPAGLSDMADHLLRAMLDQGANEDDVALIAMRPRERDVRT